jgi:hypothetical protein
LCCTGMPVASAEPLETLVALPDPGAARTLDGLVERLRCLKVWAGDPSCEVITERGQRAVDCGAWTAADRPGGDLARRVPWTVSSQASGG